MRLLLQEAIKLLIGQPCMYTVFQNAPGILSCKSSKNCRL